MVPPGGGVQTGTSPLSVMAAPPRGAVFLVGPTGSGKTSLSLRLCERLGERAGGRAACEIISVDSVLVYRGMDIGTAKPAPEARRQVPHHLVDILDPGETWSAAEFTRSARALVSGILAEGRLPLLVGGTMFYFHALEYGLDHVPDVDSDTRREVDEQERERGLTALYDELRRVDAASASRLHPHDSQRIRRALEVYRASGRALSEFQSGRAGRAAPFPVLKLGLSFREREVLHDNIERRFDGMLAAGLVDEVGRLMLRADLDRGLPAMRAAGYSQAWAHLLGECSREEMRTRALGATRRVAKRQMTWMRGMKNLRLYEVDRTDPEALVAALEREIVEFSGAIT